MGTACPKSRAEKRVPLHIRGAKGNQWARAVTFSTKEQARRPVPGKSETRQLPFRCCSRRFSMMFARSWPDWSNRCP